jgi:hypothetical protein
MPEWDMCSVPDRMRRRSALRARNGVGTPLLRADPASPGAILDPARSNFSAIRAAERPKPVCAP